MYSRFSLMLCGLLVLSQTQMPLHGQTRTITLPKADLSIDVPVLWNQTGDGERNSPLILTSPFTGDMVILINMPLERMVPIDPEFRRRTIAELTAKPGIVVTGSDSPTFAGISSFRVNASSQDQARHMTHYSMVANNHLIALTFISLSGLTPENNPIMGKVLASVHFNKPPKTFQTDILNGFKAAQGAGYILGALFCLGSPLLLLAYFIFRAVRKNRARPTPHN